jgi:hypothetical protein
VKIIVAGHVYEVENVDSDTFPPGVQRIEFVQRRDGAGELLPEHLRQEGILSQELLRVLIDRTLYLNAENPCREDVEIVDSLRDVLRAYEARAARRSIEKLSMPERRPRCPICHHLLCFHSDDEKADACG